jgi:hypothetical protein
VGQGSHAGQEQQVSEAKPQFKGRPGFDPAAAGIGTLCGEVIYRSM